MEENRKPPSFLIHLRKPLPWLPLPSERASSAQLRENSAPMLSGAFEDLLPELMVRILDVVWQKSRNLQQAMGLQTWRELTFESYHASFRVEKTRRCFPTDLANSSKPYKNTKSWFLDKASVQRLCGSPSSPTSGI